MNLIKIILIAVGVLVAAMLAFSIIGIVYSTLWYLFLFGVVAIGGAIGYKLLIKEKEAPQLAENVPTGIAELKNAERALNEYKRKSLSE